MEAAAVFAVAERRSIHAAAGFVVADSLLHRQPRADSPATTKALHSLFTAALTALPNDRSDTAPTVSKTLK